MKILEQLGVVLTNQPGALAAVCDALAAAHVNIYALSVSDTVDHAVVRMVVSDPRKALHVFESRGTCVIENDVLVLENDNKPGSLSQIAAQLAAKKINIEYAYLATLPSAKKGMLVLRVDNPKKAARALRAAGIS